MKLNSAQVEQTLAQFKADVIPEDHPVARTLNELFGDHTFFLSDDGLNVIEPKESTQTGVSAATVVNVASWNAQLTSLTPHEPESTDVVVLLERSNN